mmetsp:Transcript_6860/g.20118  ORF Transcript_6860/g.20118 Transcript_6860/m.20118 type:complete len:98 (-) Transcript_6860:691-984(-)
MIPICDWPMNASSCGGCSYFLPRSVGQYQRKQNEKYQRGQECTMIVRCRRRNEDEETTELPIRIAAIFSNSLHAHEASSVIDSLVDQGHEHCQPFKI